MAKWKLDDNSTGSTVTWTFQYNPNEATLPNRSANYVTSVTVAPNGQRIRFQGQDNAPTFSFSGAILYQAEFTTMNTWSQKRYPLTLTDDLGQSWDVVIKEWTFKRLNRHSYPWRIDYSATLEVL